MNRKKPKSLRRDKRVMVRLTQDEIIKCDALATKYGTNMAAVLRQGLAKLK